MKNKEIFLIDFTHSFDYLWHGSHKLQYNVISKTGNTMFESHHQCQGIGLSRRDDIESLIYIFAYLTNNGILPWSNEML